VKKILKKSTSWFLLKYCFRELVALQKISNSKLTFKKFWVLESALKFSKTVLHDFFWSTVFENCREPKEAPALRRGLMGKRWERLEEVVSGLEDDVLMGVGLAGLDELGNGRTIAKDCVQLLGVDLSPTNRVVKRLVMRLAVDPKIATSGGR
jgi:hypothetical protein